MRFLRPLLCIAAVLGLIWMTSDLVVDIFWCSGCRRTVIVTHALIALTFLAGLIAGLIAAAYAQVKIDVERERERRLRYAQENGVEAQAQRKRDVITS